MECKTVKELKQLCKTNGIKGYSKWKKEKLIEELSKDTLYNQGDLKYKTKAKLIELCKTKGIKGYSKWKKEKFIEELSRTEAFIPGTQTLINPQPGSSRVDISQDQLSQVRPVRNQMTYKELRQICKDRGVKGYSNWNTQKLIEELSRLGYLYHPPLNKDIPIIESDSPTKADTQINELQTNNNIPIQTDLPTDDRLHVENITMKYIKKYTTHQLIYKIKLVDLAQIENDIQKMIDLVKNNTNFKKGDKFQLTLNCPNLSRPITDSIDKYDNAKQIIDYFHRALKYEEEFDLDKTIFSAQITNIPLRGCGSGTKIINYAEDKITKKSITLIKNKDKLCLPRAIIVALTYQNDPMIFKKLGLYDKEITANEIIYIRKGRNIQKILAENLCVKLYKAVEPDDRKDVPIEHIIALYNEDGFTPEDIINVEILLDIQIKIVCLENFNAVIYSGPDKDITLYLYKNMNHFDVINSMRGFYGSSYFCKICNTPYYNKGKHTCKVKKATTCHDCFGPLHDNEEHIETYCLQCNIYFYYKSCFDKHIIKNVCDYKKRCDICEELYYPTKNPHKCGYSKCRNCGEEVITKEHKCYIKRTVQKGGICACANCKKCVADKIKKGMLEPCEDKHCILCACCSYTEKYIFFDYEAMQDSGTHIPNLIVAQYYDGQKFIFKTNDDFCNWLISKEHKGYTCIAHNTKAYDTHFILQHCVANGLSPYTIYNGSKIMLLSINGLQLKIIDSISFVQGPLSSFPKTFGLTELKKGYFPHYFNIPENQDYIGTLPDIKYYSPNTMKKEARNTFLKWHAEKIKDNYVFDFQKDLLAYCESDVDILRRGCIEMRKNFLEIGNLDPFRYITIAGVCMAIFRSKYLKDNTIGVINKEQKDCYSEISISWLNSFKNNDIKHALNGGEEIICGAKVDGYDKETNTVYQFHGCFWHGCQKCYTPDKINHVTKTHYRYLHNKTTLRSEILRRHGYNVVEMWECNWSKEYKKRKKVNANIIKDLDPRDSFFGGRTNATKLKYNVKHGEKIRYIDVCSLYPTVQFYDDFPIDHPIIIEKPTCYNKDWFGMIQCKILPPRGLYHPVLPLKIKTTDSEKLMFPLCQTCSKTLCNECSHDDEQRCLTGTWTTIEVNKAIEKGYQIKEIYNVWHYEQKSNEMFKDYVRDFMKIKLESSPWQNDFKTMDEYINTVKSEYNIDLQPDKIKPNPGRRAVAKICLNSLWGKFGQNQNKPKTEYVQNSKRFYEILLDDRLKDINCVFVNDDTVHVTYKYKDHHVQNDHITNIVIASYTTAHARLRLYEMLDRLGDKILYYDTDSVFYVDDGTNTVETGCMLGEWTDELGKDTYIVEFLSTGPKSYSYKINNCVCGDNDKECKCVCKIKGFTLNYQNSQNLNHEALRQLINKDIDSVEIKYKNIARDKQTKQLVNKDETKTFKLTYDKRIIKLDQHCIDTLPYGY